MAKVAPIEIENSNERRPSLTDGVKEVDQTDRRKYNLGAVDGNYNNSLRYILMVTYLLIFL